MTGTPPLLVVTAGGLAREVLVALRRRSARTVLGVLDDDPTRWGTYVGGARVLGGLECIADHPDAAVLVAAGRGSARRSIAARLAVLGVQPRRHETVVHPGADVAAARIGRGAIVLSGVVATADVVLGEHVVVMPNVTLTHDDVVDTFATLCAGVTLGGGVRIGEAAYVGMSAAVREGVSVGAGAVVGMGAVVLRDVPAGETWVGVPAARHDVVAAVGGVVR